MQQKNFLLVALCILSLVFNVNAKDPFRNRVDEFRLDMIKLWGDHITYTRNFIISTVANLPDLNPITQRLLQNQDDIGKAFKPYYGRKIARRLTNLLREHILLAADVVADAKAGNTQKFNIDYQLWQQNAREIASFLSDINPNWSRRELERMLFEHLEFTTAEAASRLQANWQADIQANDRNHVHMLMFSDILTAGIIKQFPKRF